jgi:hypothetical protein
MQEKKSAWMATRETHNQNLKPSLGNENARTELDALCEHEKERHE